MIMSGWSTVMPPSDRVVPTLRTIYWPHLSRLKLFFFLNRTVNMPVRGVVVPDWNRDIIYSCSVDVENRMLRLYRYVEGGGHKGWWIHLIGWGWTGVRVPERRSPVKGKLSEERRLQWWKVAGIGLLMYVVKPKDEMIGLLANGKDWSR